MTTAAAVLCIEELRRLEDDWVYICVEGAYEVKLLCKEMMAWDISCTSSGWI